MKISKEQIKRFEEEREKLLHDIVIFKKGIAYAEEIIQQETRRKSWLDAFTEAVNCLNLDTMMILDRSIDMTKPEDFGFAVGIYFLEINKVFLKEFKNVIPPFDTALKEYEAKIYQILFE